MKRTFSPPDITELEIEEVVDALRSGWITTGPKTKLFEKKIANYVGSKYCVCLNSQTACAELSLRILGVKPGDEVITSAYTYSASASVIDHVGAKIILIDTQKDSYEMDYDALENAITSKTKAIIPVDIAGVVCNYAKIYEIIERKKHLFNPESKIQKALGRIAIMADTAHSFGAIKDGVKAGMIADFSSFSFHAVKNLTTAEGGAVTWREIEGIDSEEIYKEFQLLSLHGQSKDALCKTQLGTWDYDILGTWYKCNMTDVAAAIGLKQLERYPSLLSRRKAIIEKYDQALIPLGIQTLKHYTENMQSSGHLYLTRIPNITLEERNEIIIKMANLGIATNVHYKPLPLFTAYKNLGFDIKDYPNSYNQFVNEITLPLHTSLTDDEVDYIIESYKKVIKEYLR